MLGLFLKYFPILLAQSRQARPMGGQRYLCGINPEMVTVGIKAEMLQEFPPALICAKCRAIYEKEPTD